MLLIQDSATRQQILEHPDLVAALVAAAQAESGWTCEAVADTLAAYVDAEQTGDHSRPHYQPLRTHLQRCPLCYEDYALVRSIISAQHAGKVPRWPLQAHAGIVLSRAALNRTLQAHAATAGRAWPIYVGQVPDLPDLTAQIMLEPPAPGGSAGWQLHVTLTGPQVVGLRIMLRYETELRAQRTDATGCACFADVPASWLATQGGPDLLLLFVADTQPQP